MTNGLPLLAGHINYLVQHRRLTLLHPYSRCIAPAHPLNAPITLCTYPYLWLYVY